MKGIIATATSSEQSVDKFELNEAFRRLVYASDEEVFRRYTEEWNKLTFGVTIRVGAGDSASYSLLEDYYYSSWEPQTSMWAMYKRKQLPVGSENTNNRVENCFGLLKADLRLNNTGNVTIAMAVLQIISWSEGRLVIRYTQAQRKRAHIFDPDPVLMAEYKAATKELNDTGCKYFKKAVDAMKIYKENLIKTEGGVTEKFKSKSSDDFDDDEWDDDLLYTEDLRNNTYREYSTTENSCNCTRHIQDCSPCRHILFCRSQANLLLYDKTLFCDFFYLERIGDIDEETLPEDIEPDDKHSIDKDIIVAINDIVVKDIVIDPGKRYKMIKEGLDGLLDIILHNGTAMVKEYAKEIEILKKRVRQGKTMLRGTKAADKKSVVSIGTTLDNTDIFVKDVNNDTNDNNVVEEITDDQNVEIKGELDQKLSLRFLNSIKSRGRPKKTGAGKLKFPKSNFKTNNQSSIVQERYDNDDRIVSLLNVSTVVDNKSARDPI